MGKDKTLSTNFETTEHLATSTQHIIYEMKRRKKKLNDATSSNDDCLIETLFLWMLAVLSYLSFAVPEKAQDILFCLYYETTDDLNSWSLFILFPNNIYLSCYIRF